jgi:hypothetical protein
MTQAPRAPPEPPANSPAQLPGFGDLCGRQKFGAVGKRVVVGFPRVTGEPAVLEFRQRLDDLCPRRFRGRVVGHFEIWPG